MKSSERKLQTQLKSRVTALGAIGLSFSSLVYGMPTPATSSGSPRSLLGQAMTQVRGGNGGGGKAPGQGLGTTTGPAVPNKSDPRINLAAYGLHVGSYNSALPVTQSVLNLLNDSTATSQLLGATGTPGESMSDTSRYGQWLNTCQQQRGTAGSGTLNVSCLLDSFHGKGLSPITSAAVISPDAAPAKGTNWNPASHTVPFSIDNTDPNNPNLEQPYLDHLASYGNMANYNVVTPTQSYYDYWNGVTANNTKNMGKLLPAMDAVWGSGKTTIKIGKDGDQGTLTWEAGSAT